MSQLVDNRPIVVLNELMRQLLTAKEMVSAGMSNYVALDWEGYPPMPIHYVIGDFAICDLRLVPADARPLIGKNTTPGT